MAGPVHNIVLQVLQWDVDSLITPRHRNSDGNLPNTLSLPAMPACPRLAQALVIGRVLSVVAVLSARVRACARLGKIREGGEECLVGLIQAAEGGAMNSLNLSQE